MSPTSLTPKAAALLAALIGLAACSGSSSGDSNSGGSVRTVGAPSAQTATVGMNDKLRFVPTTVLASVGSVTLDVDNLGGTPHNLVFDDAGIGKTGTVAGHAKEPLTVRFTKAGTYAFECTFHPGMTGKVVVS